MSLRTLAAASLLIATAGCASYSTTYDYDPGFAFAGPLSWDWAPDRTPDTNEGDIAHSRIEAAIELAMAEKGIARNESDPDVRVVYHLALDDQVDYQTINTYYGDRWGWGWYRGPWRGAGIGMSTSETREHHRTVGTMVIDIFDAETNEMIWRGSGEGNVHEISDPRERQREAEAHVRQVLENFPPAG